MIQVALPYDGMKWRIVFLSHLLVVVWGRRVSLWLKMVRSLLHRVVVLITAILRSCITDSEIELVTLADSFLDSKIAYLPVLRHPRRIV